VAFLAAASACAASDSPERRAGAADEDFVRVRVPLSAEAAAPAVARALDALIDRGWNGSFDLRRFRRYPMQVPPSPQTAQMRATAAGNPALLRYVDLPAAARAQDQFIYEPTTDYFWPSVYQRRGQPLPFRCAFVVHLQAAGPGSTTIEVLEYLPVVRNGKKLSWSAHGVLPGLHQDQRVVRPTTEERRELAAAVAAALRSAP
jgi:hypothetical protein